MRRITSDPSPAQSKLHEKRDFSQEVTDSIVRMLEDDVAPWQKPWEATGVPLNPTAGKVYRGGNAIHLMATGIRRASEDPRWMTYRQAAKQGWQVRLVGNPEHFTQSCEQCCALRSIQAREVLKAPADCG